MTRTTGSPASPPPRPKRPPTATTPTPTWPTPAPCQSSGRVRDITGPREPPPVTYSSHTADGRLTSTNARSSCSSCTPAACTTSYPHDHANRLTGISYSDATPAVTFGYDNAGN